MRHVLFKTSVVLAAALAAAEGAYADNTPAPAATAPNEAPGSTGATSDTTNAGTLPQSETTPPTSQPQGNVERPSATQPNNAAPTSNSGAPAGAANPTDTTGDQGAAGVRGDEGTTGQAFDQRTTGQGTDQGTTSQGVNQGAVGTSGMTGAEGERGAAPGVTTEKQAPGFARQFNIAPYIGITSAPGALSNAVLTYGGYFDSPITDNVLVGANLSWWGSNGTNLAGVNNMSDLILGLHAKYNFTGLALGVPLTPYVVGGVDWNRFSLAQNTVTPTAAIDKTYTWNLAFGLDYGAGLLYKVTQNMNAVAEVKRQSVLSNKDSEPSQNTIDVGAAWSL